MEAKKISDAVWELPKTGKMLVPVRIYATEKLMKKIQEDRTLIQASNVAQLKGIVNSSIVLPDAHEGYGFSIGGVAAFDFNEGIISPGGVGYDISCLTEDTKILTEFGYFKEIKDFEEDFKDIEIENSNFLITAKKVMINLPTLNLASKIEEPKPINLLLKKKASDNVYRITTELGFSVKASEDHPILTKDGMKNTSFLKNGDEIAICPFEGVPYEKPTDERILDLIDFQVNIAKVLSEKGLLPLSLNNDKIPHLAKILGYLFGDGTLYFSNKKGYTCFYGKYEDLAEIQKDIHKIGFNSAIHIRKRQHSITTQYGKKSFASEEYALHVKSTPFAELMKQLGCPVGKKASQEYSVPNWIIKSPLWIKRLFLASFFGAEMSTPKTYSKTSFYTPIISQNKNTNFLEDGRKFMIDIMKMIEEFDVKVSKISQRKEFRNKEGETMRLRLIVGSNEQNLLKLFERIGFEYNQKRKIAAKIAAFYIRKKKIFIEKRATISKQVKAYKKKGLSLKEVQQILTSEIANTRFIERHYYEKAKQRINQAFISFEEFFKLNEENIKKYGAMFDKISFIKKVDYSGYIYDFNVEGNHNFMANSILVSNCGVRLITTKLEEHEIKPKLQQLTESIFREVPSGVGAHSKLRISNSQLDEILEKGAEWAVDNNYGRKEDLQHTEDYGRIKAADAGKVSQKAKQRGLPEVGTLGSGNHYLEIQKVEKIFLPDVARVMGIEKEGQITTMIHCGSRGLGHQVATDYLRVMEQAMQKYKIIVPDRELACAPAQSDEAQNYFAAACASVNYSLVNRQMILHWVRECFKRALGKSEEELGLDMVFDVSHNIVKLEEHEVEGKKQKLWVHRKGATRGFSPDHEQLPKEYKEIGQPVIIGGSMGTFSYVLVGTEQAEKETFSSTCHGAGRTASRAAAMRQMRGEDVKREMEKMGIIVRSASIKTLSEEADFAYKDINSVVEACELAGISKKVCRFKPLAVIKG